jgi:LicD family
MLMRIVRRGWRSFIGFVDRFGPIDRFASAWDDEARLRQQELLRRIAEVAEVQHLKLFLFWGSLLGQIREGQILDWDDDVDLALFDADDPAIAAFLAALEQSGLKSLVLNPGERIIKIYDPGYPAQTGQPWRWPFVDLFAYTAPDRPRPPLESSPVALELITPGQRVCFETAPLWLAENPLAVLDLLYADWRTTERSPSWCHRMEKPILATRTRRIITDAVGRKVF